MKIATDIGSSELFIIRMIKSIISVNKKEQKGLGQKGLRQKGLGQIHEDGSYRLGVFNCSSY